MVELRTDFPDLPPYTYVPGYAPHPVSAPDGHMQQTRPPDTWSQQDHLLWGKRLFEHGYYWEAHEAWEYLWLELGRTSEDALTVKGLIKLSASAVKCREGNATGAIRHASRAAELLRPGSHAVLFESCNLTAAYESANRIADSPPIDHVSPSGQAVSLPGLQV